MAANKITASTQQHLDIETIDEDLVVLKTGWVALVLKTTAVNFDLLSEAEQDATIYAYGALLNSLSFPTQILIRTKKADITSYFAHLAEAEKTQTNPDLKRQIQKYEDFIQTTVQQKTVLEKEFYVIIDYSPLEVGVAGLISRGQKSRSRIQLVNDAKIALYPKKDHLVKQLTRLGLTAKQLTTQELIELFYDIYNPAPTGIGRVILDRSSYTNPMVRPAVEVPVPSYAKASEGEPAHAKASEGEPAHAKASEGEPAHAPSISLRATAGTPTVGGGQFGNQVRLQSAVLGSGSVFSEAGEIKLRPVPPMPEIGGQKSEVRNQNMIIDPIVNQANQSQSQPQVLNVPLEAKGNQGVSDPTVEQALKNLQEATMKATQVVGTEGKQK